ncbi:MAG: pyridoxamine 5'-phosphate oxidase [Bacteroidia bacterium]
MSTKKLSIHTLRKNYGLYRLDENYVSNNPLKQFELWMNEALQMNVKEPNAMNLSTVTQNRRPSSRIVLLRGFDKKGFVFYTNYLSVKGHNLASNPFAALTFFWPELEKQVRIEGKVMKVSKAISDAYFNSRPRESQTGAWASSQSEVLKNRGELEEMFENLTEKFKGKPIPRPKYWGGYCLIPDKIEFWQGRSNRLHDRILYEKLKRDRWKISRLAP